MMTRSRHRQRRVTARRAQPGASLSTDETAASISILASKSENDDETSHSNKIQTKRNRLGKLKDDADSQNDDHHKEEEEDSSRVKRRSRKGKQPEESKVDSNSSSSATTAAAASPSPTDAVFGNGDIATVLYSFLDLRDLYQWVISSKRTMELFQGNNTAACHYYKPIVRAAMLVKKPRAKLETVLPLLQARQIWSLSPLQLLCLLNGVKCRRCGIHNGTTSVNKAFGVNYCSKTCLYTGMGKRYGVAKTICRNNKWCALIQHPRLARIDCKNFVFVWEQPVTDPHTRAPYGPILSKEQLLQIQKENPTSTDQQLEALEQLLTTLDQQDPHAAARAEALTQAYQTCRSLALQRDQEQKDQREQRAAQATAHRRQKITAWIHALQAHMPPNGPWQAALSRHTWDDAGHVRFECRFLNPVLEEFSHAPVRSQTKKELQRASQILTKKFALIRSNHFHDLSFLAPSSSHEGNDNPNDDDDDNNTPFYRALWLHFQTRVEQLEPEFRVRTKTLKFLQKGDRIQALRSCFQSDLVEAVATALLERVTVDGGAEYVRGAMRLATEFFKMNMDRSQDMAVIFNYCSKNFPTLYNACVEHDMVLDPWMFLMQLKQQDVTSPLRKLLWYMKEEQHIFRLQALGGDGGDND